MTSPAPDWWRGRAPEPIDMYSDWILSGHVTDIDTARLNPGTYENLVKVAFDQAVVTGVTICLEEAHYSAVWSQFHGCTFTQRTRRLIDGAAAQGMLANRPTLYRGCTFSRVQFGSPGRFTLGDATFEDCVFDNCAWRSMYVEDADFVRCVFRGEMRSAVFRGVSLGTGRASRYEDNDFSAAVISDNVSWRAEFPLDRQTWPSGYDPYAHASP